jgi:hypothetical protein
VLKFKVSTEIIIIFFLFLGFWGRVDALVDADVSEKHTASVFQGWSDKENQPKS